jgi:hypothetical protein
VLGFPRDVSEARQHDIVFKADIPLLLESWSVCQRYWKTFDAVMVNRFITHRGIEEIAVKKMVARWDSKVGDGESSKSGAAASSYSRPLLKRALLDGNSDVKDTELAAVADAPVTKKPKECECDSCAAPRTVSAAAVGAPAADS